MWMDVGCTCGGEDHDVPIRRCNLGSGDILPDNFASLTITQVWKV